MLVVRHGPERTAGHARDRSRDRHRRESRTSRVSARAPRVHSTGERRSRPPGCRGGLRSAPRSREGRGRRPPGARFRQLGWSPTRRTRRARRSICCRRRQSGTAVLAWLPSRSRAPTRPAVHRGRHCRTPTGLWAGMSSFLSSSDLSQFGAWLVNGDTCATLVRHLRNTCATLVRHLRNTWFVANPGRFVRGGAAIFCESVSLSHSPLSGCGASASALGKTLIMRTDVLFVKSLRRLSPPPPKDVWCVFSSRMPRAFR